MTVWQEGKNVNCLWSSNGDDFKTKLENVGRMKFLVNWLIILERVNFWNYRIPNNPSTEICATKRIIFSIQQTQNEKYFHYTHKKIEMEHFMHIAQKGIYPPK